MPLSKDDTDALITGIVQSFKIEEECLTDDTPGAMTRESLGRMIATDLSKLPHFDRAKFLARINVPS